MSNIISTRISGCRFINEGLVGKYEPRFVESGIELAPLTMPLSAAGEPFLFSDLPELT